MADTRRYHTVLQVLSTMHEVDSSQTWVSCYSRSDAALKISVSRIKRDIPPETCVFLRSC